MNWRPLQPKPKASTWTIRTANSHDLKSGTKALWRLENGQIGNGRYSSKVKKIRVGRSQVRNSVVARYDHCS